MFKLNLSVKAFSVIVKFPSACFHSKFTHSIENAQTLETQVNIAAKFLHLDEVEQFRNT